MNFDQNRIQSIINECVDNVWARMKQLNESPEQGLRQTTAISLEDEATQIVSYEEALGELMSRIVDKMPESAFERDTEGGIYKVGKLILRGHYYYQSDRKYVVIQFSDLLEEMCGGYFKNEYSISSFKLARNLLSVPKKVILENYDLFTKDIASISFNKYSERINQYTKKDVSQKTFRIFRRDLNKGLFKIVLGELMFDCYDKQVNRVMWKYMGCNKEYDDRTQRYYRAKGSHDYKSKEQNKYYYTWQMTDANHPPYKLFSKLPRELQRLIYLYIKKMSGL